MLRGDNTTQSLMGFSQLAHPVKILFCPLLKYIWGIVLKVKGAKRGTLKICAIRGKTGLSVNHLQKKEAETSVAVAVHPVPPVTLSTPGSLPFVPPATRAPVPLLLH